MLSVLSRTLFNISYRIHIKNKIVVAIYEKICYNHNKAIKRLKGIDYAINY